MVLKSPLEDFAGTTLAAVPGLLAKLNYFASLHDGHGNYLHWGMERVHGQEPARRALRTLHAEVLTQVLRTPLRHLNEDLTRSMSDGQMTTRELLQSLMGQVRRALPARAAAPSEKHLKAVLHALSALAKNQEPASHPDALPPPPPVQ